jgi:TM2 domain-containing membrane protein YozV
MNCPNCGAAVPPGTNRCQKCGGFVEQQAAQPASQVPMQPATAQPQAPVQTGPAVKSKIAAGLFGIFLGSLGIHRFYLGYVGVGVVQLLMTVLFSWFTCGITGMAAGIWGLVEGIMILAGSMNTDSLGRPLKE